MRTKSLSATLGFVIITIFMCSITFAASFQKGEMLYKHGLTVPAQKELIDIVFSKADQKEKAKSLYLLGVIAIENGRFRVAFDTWTQLIKNYPSSKQAKKIKGQLDELTTILTKISDEKISDARARAYIKSGDFWSERRAKIYSIDNSWIPEIEAACKWYDLVIKDFPGSSAARVAYQHKLFTILGWKKRGRYDEAGGVKGNAHKWLPELIATFNSFKKAFPDDPSLQTWRYQIAQAYWSNKNWSKTKEWLNLIVKKAGSKESFYKDLAKRRLQKVEY